MQTDLRAAALGGLAELADGSDPRPSGFRPPAPWKSLDDVLAGLWVELAAAHAEIADLRERLAEDGDAIILGGRAAEDAAHYGEPLAVYMTPTRWAVDGRTGALVLNWAAAPRDLVKALRLDQHSRIIAEDGQTADLLRAVLDAAGVTVASIRVSRDWEDRPRAA
jgi:hypothetical protein